MTNVPHPDTPITNHDIRDGFTFVDLFAGCGGLSLGLRAAGGSELLAVERAKDAANSLYTNLIASERTFQEHLGLAPEGQIDAGLLADSVETLLRLGWTPSRAVDVVVGGPPCQGFSLAGRRDRADARNQLVWRFLDAVSSLDPKVVVIENVEGMNQKFSQTDEPNDVDNRSTFAQVLQALALTGQGYVTVGIRVNAMHYGAAQHRPRLMAVGVRHDVAEVLGLQPSTEIWSSHFLPVDSPPVYAPVPTVERAYSVSDAIGDLAEIEPEGYSSSYLMALNEAFSGLVRSGQRGSLENNEHRNHRARTRTRFSVLQQVEALGGSPRLLGPMSKAHRDEATKQLLNAVLSADQFTFTEGGVDYGAEAFVELVGDLANNKHSQRPLRWGAPARTVMTIPDDHIHPTEPRTFSVREMARFQGFPDNFVFKGKATTGGQSRRADVPQYSQVGNAVSPLVARAVGDMLQRILFASS